MDKKIKFITVLYALGIILVVFGHSHYSSGDSNAVYNTINGFIYVFHMPLFFWIAGFLFLNSSVQKPKIDGLAYLKWIGNKALRLLVPYFVLSIIFVFPKYYVENGNFGGIGMYLVHSLYMPRQSVWGHFWFLPVLFNMYVLFGFLKMVLNSKNEILIVLILFVLSVVLYFMPIDSEILGLTDLRKLTVFFMIGMISNLVYRRIANLHFLSNIWISLTIALVFLIGGFLVYYFIGSPIVLFIDSIFLIFSFVAFSNILQNNRWLIFVGENNYTIYLYSWIFQSFLMFGLGKIGAPWYLAFIAMFIVGLGLPLVIVLIYKKCNKIQNRLFDLILGINRR